MAEIGQYGGGNRNAQQTAFGSFARTHLFKGAIALVFLTVIGIGGILWQLAPPLPATATGGAYRAADSEELDPTDRASSWGQGSGGALGPAAFAFGNDDELNEAVRLARLRQDRFEAEFAKGGPGLYSVKVILSDGDISEPVWVTLDSIRDGDYIGMVANLPDNLKFISKDQSIQIGRSEIVDWMIQRDDLIFGAYTTRIIFNRSADEKAIDVLKQIRDLEG